MAKTLQVPVNAYRLEEAVAALNLASEKGHAQFQAKLEKRGLKVAELMAGFSQSNIKLMRRKVRDWPSTLPHDLIEEIYKEVKIDLTPLGVLELFAELDFGIRLEITVETQNDQGPQTDRHVLKDLVFETQEAHATAADPNDEDIELDLRIGFSRLRMILFAPEIKSTENQMRAETSPDPVEGYSRDYVGEFDMRFAGREPLSWIFEARHDGKLLKNTLKADGLFARIEAARGAALMAELTAARDALKVRVVQADGSQIDSRKQAEEHRNKMKAALVRKDISNAGSEYLIYRKILAG